MHIDWDELFNAERPRPQPVQVGRRWLLAVALLVLLAFGGGIVGLLTDWWWFQSLGQAAVLRTRLLLPAGLFLAAWAVGAAWLAGNWLWAGRQVADQDTFKGQVDPAAVRSATRRTVLAAAAGLAALFAVGLAGRWADVLLLAHRQPFGAADPLFGQDVGFYVFALPVWQLVRGLALGWVLAALVGAVLLYAAGGLAELGRGRFRLDRSARAHVLALAALVALLWAAGMWLARYALLFTRHTAAYFGPGHADVTASIPVYGLLAGLGVVAALTFLVAIRWGGWRLPAWTVAITAGLWLAAGLVFPALIQAWRVRPNELVMDRPYIAHNIAATRAAFGLADVTTTVYQPTGAVTGETVGENAATLANIRLWDWRVFEETVSQVQAIRSYYGFVDVDVDRYPTTDGHRQVNLTVRELLPELLQNPSWVNRHLEYTHGFGAVVSPIDEVADRGLPVLWMQDIPPVATAPYTYTLTQPRVYFGEAAGDGYVAVGARQEEFDYPAGDANMRTRYSGADGVAIGSLWRRLVFALRYGDGEILLSSAFTPDSRLLMYRDVEARVQRLAPFLSLDHDPYAVITDDGRLVWIIDAYTTTDRYPYSTPLSPEAGSNGQLAGLAGASYLRNSVKVAVDAYEGTVRFYVVDPTDPLARAWASAFPGLFSPAAEVPPDLAAHWRYPETLFRAQTAQFADYHVVDPDTFYNAEDRWAVPNESGLDGGVGPMPPYYVTMRLRGEEAPEFVLIRPFSPVGKDNMVAWLAARADPGHYGELVLYQFAKGSLVYGPSQIESLIQQDPAISAQVTLWGQSGSRVSYGNLLVIPMGDGILYVEPLYLRSEQGNALPELKRVIVAVQDRVVMRETLAEAVAALFETTAGGAASAGAAGSGAGAGAAGGGPRPTPAATPAATDVGGLVRAARGYQAEAAAALAQSDWLAFGRAMDGLQRTLARLGELTGVDGLPAAGATAAPGPSPAPAGAP